MAPLPSAPTSKPPPAASTPEDPDAWLQAYTDPGVRAVFAHLARHGSISEAEATRMLGSARAFRRFSRKFDAYAQQCRFRITIEHASTGKRYVRQGASA